MRWSWSWRERRWVPRCPFCQQELSMPAPGERGRAECAPCEASFTAESLVEWWRVWATDRAFDWGPTRRLWRRWDRGLVHWEEVQGVEHLAAETPTERAQRVMSAVQYRQQRATILLAAASLAVSLVALLRT